MDPIALFLLVGGIIMIGMFVTLIFSDTPDMEQRQNDDE